MDNMQAAISDAMDNLNNLKWFRRLPPGLQAQVRAAMQQDIGELDQSSPIAAIVTLAITATGQELVIKQIEAHLGPQLRILGVNLN
jgi:hypothetical protein